MKKLTTILFLSMVVFSCASFIEPPLHRAIRTGNLAKLIKLNEEGANLTYVWYKSPLERAVENNRIEILDYLVSQGPSSDIGKQISWLNDSKKYEMSKIVYNSINKQGLDINKYGNSFSPILLYNDDLNIDEKITLIKSLAGDKFSSPYLLLSTRLEYLEKMIVSFNMNLNDTIDENDATVLHRAALYSKFELVEYLLKKSIDINKLDKNAHTALFYAITSFGPSVNWKKPIIENENESKINYIGDMPFYRNPRDVMTNQVGIVKLLIEHGININQQNYAGWTVLHFAKYGYSVNLQEYLISSGADKNIKTNYGRSVDDIINISESLMSRKFSAR
jgi:ankyrin repeat protein